MSLNEPLTFALLSVSFGVPILVLAYRQARFLKRPRKSSRFVIATILTVGAGAELALVFIDGTDGALSPAFIMFLGIVPAAMVKAFYTSPGVVASRKFAGRFHMTALRGWLLSLNLDVSVEATDDRIEGVIDEFPQRLIQAFGREDVRDAMLLGIEEAWGTPDQWLELNRQSAQAERSPVRRLLAWVLGGLLATQR